MKERLYLIDLYDIYESLLTEKQRMYFEDYYFNNYSLSEISENYGISRNAIHKALKETEEKLNNFEDNLKINEKNKKILSLIKDNELLKKIEKIIEE